MKRLICLLVLAVVPVLYAEEQADILIDAVHANDFSYVGLVSGEYDYHRIFGFRTALEYLRHSGVRTAIHSEGRLTPEKLSGHRLLFLNLVSAECPPFYVQEIDAIVEFVRAGGSLFVITEHSNAYFHSWRLAPLMAEFDITMPTDTACEVPPFTLGTGSGWILIEKFTEHPVTKGLRRIHFQTGGCVDDRYAVAWTSPGSWADAWRFVPYAEKLTMGNYGNWKKDEGERSGPLGVVLAREFGKGRIVIVGDQNMFGDLCLDYADNYRLWINAVDWLLGGACPGLNDPARYRAFRKPRILLLEDSKHGAFGADDKAGCYHLASHLRRKHVAMTDDRYEEPYELVVISNGQLNVEDAIIDVPIEHLRQGRPVMVLHTAPEVIENDEAMLTRILRKTGTEAPRFEDVNGSLKVVRTGVGGKVYLFSSVLSLFNSDIANPSSSPNVWQQYRADAFDKQLEWILENGK